MGRVVKKPPSFKEKHATSYGLKVSARAPGSSMVTSVVCQFCKSFGREEKPGCLRKPTSRHKVFQKFQTTLYASHVQGQHPTKWAEYEGLQTEEQRTAFFEPIAVQQQQTIHTHFGGDDCVIFDLKKEIVQVIIGDILFHPDDVEGVTHASALALFEAVSSPSEAVGSAMYIVGYVARVKNRRRFNLLVQFIACGSTFCRAAQQMECVKIETVIGDYGGCSDRIAANYARVVCAQSLQLLAQCLSQVWAFSLAFDGSTHQGMSYLDVRVRFGKNGEVHNYHLLAIPLFERHTGEYMFEVLVPFLDAISSTWRNSVISVSTDGAPSMTGRLSGLVTRLQDACPPGLLRIWCGLHQFDLVMQRVYASAMDDKFYSTLTGLIGHLRRQQNLISEMQTTCPKVASTRWISMGSVTEWLTKHHVQIRRHLLKKAPACAPEHSWWCVLFIVHAIATEASAVFTALQGKYSLLTEQRDRLLDLVHTYCAMSGMVGHLHKHEIAAAIKLEPTEVCGSFALTVENAAISMAGTSIWVCETMADIHRSNQPELERIARSTARGFVQAANGISKIVAERDQSNQPFISDPRVLPHQLVKMRMASFTKMIKQHRTRLLCHFKLPEYIESIGDQFVQLQRAHRNEKELREMMTEFEKEGVSFQKSWEGLYRRFPNLATFCAGVASAFPNTATIESDFSVIGVEKNNHRTSLTDFSLEGILHCKQFNALTDLARRI